MSPRRRFDPGTRLKFEQANSGSLRRPPQSNIKTGELCAFSNRQVKVGGIM